MTGDDGRAPVLIVDNHDSYTFNLVQLVDRLTGMRPDVVAIDDFDVDDESAYAAIIVSPGPGHPLTEPHFGRCLALFRRRERAILGVCLGHQGLVAAHGGSVERVEPAHGVLSRLEHDGTGLFRGVHDDVHVVRYHSLASRDVPGMLRVTARTPDGLVMAVEHRELPHVGMQFHPESVLTEDGARMIANFLARAGVPPDGAEAPRAAPGPPSATEPESLVRYPRWVEPVDLAPVMLRGRRRAFWLDSADRRDWSGRYSVMGYLDDDDTSVVVGGPEHETPGARAVPRRDFLGRLRELGADSHGEDSGIPSMGSWVGAAGYDTQEILESTEVGSPTDGFFLRVDRVVVFDHLERTVRYGASSVARSDGVRALLDAAADAPHPETELGPIVAETDSPWAAYVRAFDRLDEALRAGDTYEAVLTFPLRYTIPGDPLDHYLALRARSPAPYAAYLRHDEHVVLSASPERMLRVGADGRAEVRPIKGTLPRDADPERDALARWRLATDEKFRRENLMITDLVRNDLGRVCRRGSVAVTQLMGVESYRGVHQLVTVVEGALQEGTTPVDALRAVFPAGSMTGAPKRRTMELIREVEREDRHLYAGAIGWFDARQADFSVIIRTLWGSDGHYRLDVGGGIIIGSTAEAEFTEALGKARSVVDRPLREVTPDRHSGVRGPDSLPPARN